MNYSYQLGDVRAIKWDGSQETIERLGYFTCCVGFASSGDSGIIIPVTLGQNKANLNDWIVKSGAGDFFIIESGIFELLFFPIIP